ncbi:GntR family transcriptional regulator [Nonomuraea longicatena]|uniref:GntR family transcriptional regulator n=1 Tax=Nonomuraea longicatena TaxID=83682 RepID=A0ABN1QVH5_9ACTN
MGRQHRTLAVQVRDQLRTMVAQEGLGPGDRLPSENDLIALFGVGRTSIREALKLLEQEGLIQARHGDGRYLTSQPSLERPLTRLAGTTDMLAERGYGASTVVLDLAVKEPTRRQLDLLRLSPGDTVVRLERLRRRDGDVLVHSTDLFPRALIPFPLGEVDWTGSLLEVLAAYDHVVEYAVTQVRAVTLADEQAARLGADAGEGAWLMLTQTHHDSSGRPLLHSVDCHRGSDFAFHLVRRRD